jgi:hypothetical protein
MDLMLIAYVLVCFWSAVVAVWFLANVLLYIKEKYWD